MEQVKQQYINGNIAPFHFHTSKKCALSGASFVWHCAGYA
jgi:hypothetical protein